ncbi:glycerol-3-phosphate dehydrogenase/oxidase [Staphylospora marina]|uniref:glycerol-3-phosphate dehydrogenase/oxidase n=1 Tax=Staphylospora marina TaxID=2490858 RepID=UPI000F5BA806|nr:FAD-dependent oxidoreductase [Staphylospora marina]
MTGRRFSVLNRRTFLRETALVETDLLVIGGGITGAGIALDAVSRGLRTVLLEMQDFAAGTSGRSTKLVHGGLRYLKQLDVRLVAEVGGERAIVHEIGPHITRPEWMLLPIIKGGTYGKWSTSLGIMVYDRLARVRKHERRIMLDREEALRREPLLRQEGLRGAACYVEYRTDDARLTLEVLKKAVEYGARAFNYVKAEEPVYDGERLTGVRAVDLLDGRTYLFRAKKVVNATGPWVDEWREKDGSKRGKTLRWSKGVHLVVDHSRFPLRQPVYFDVPDGRMIFAIPRDGKTYFGTTDTEYHGDLARPRITASDRDYLLDAVSFMFPGVRLTPEDVESSWAGIRPLIHQEGKSLSEISRRDEMFRSRSGLITIAGGKLTGYRKMAERVVDLAVRELRGETGRIFGPCRTRRIPLSGGDVGGSAGWPGFMKRKIRELMEAGLHGDDADRLVRLYGSNVDEVAKKVRESEEEASGFGIPPVLLGMLRYGVEDESVATPADFFVRRTGALYFRIHEVRLWKEPVIRWMKERFGWTEEEERHWREELERELATATTVTESD